MAAKKQVGRPKLEKEVQLQRAVSLSNTFIKKAKRIGDGNISAGIRKALEAYDG